MKTAYTVVAWLIVAFFMGASMAAGVKVVDHFWPDKPVEYIHRIQEDPDAR